MNVDSARAPERPAFAALVCLLLGPVIAHGLWRPLVHAFGPSGRAEVITLAALAISVAIPGVCRLRPGRRWLLSAALGAAIAISAALGFSLGTAGLLTLLCVTAADAFLVRWLARRLPTSLDGLAAGHKLLAALYLAVSLAAVVSTARLGIFIGDSTKVEDQVLPGVAFLENHSCLSAYVHAATLARQGVDNLYDVRWWDGSHGMAPRAAGAEDPYRPFVLDYYAYPPPFLFAMAPLAPLAGDFLAQRALWFGLNGLLLALGLWVVVRWASAMDEPNLHRVLLFAPLFFGSLPILATLQVGNFQIAVVVLSVLAMVAIDREHPALGGALLAFAILSKLSPGVLAIVLVSRRRWRALAWTAGFVALFVALSVATLGINPTRSFLAYTLPRLGSGEAFAFMDDEPFSILTNTSLFGLPFKLQLMGFDVGDPWALGRQIGRGYSVMLAILALVAGRQSGDRRRDALIWLSLLVLAALQSPFAPGYVTIGLLWSLTLLTVEVRSLRDCVLLALGWLVLTVMPPVQDLRFLAVYTVIQSALAVGIPTWLIARGARGTKTAYSSSRFMSLGASR